MTTATSPDTDFKDIVRSFVDLRAFAAHPDAGYPATETGDAWLSARRLLPVPEGAVVLASLRLDGGAGAVADLVHDEYVIVLEGGLTLTAGSAVTLAPSQAGVIPAGLSFAWTAQAGTVAIVMRCDGGAAGADHIVPVDFHATRAPSNPPAADVLLTQTPSCFTHVDYASGTAEFRVGTWHSNAFARTAIDYVHYELMLLVEGEVEFVDERSGETGIFRAGDVFVLIQGARCSWKQEGRCEKQFAIYRPN